MPVYDFVCKNCGERFSVEKSFTDDNKEKCPSCHSKQVKKLISAPAVIFKGEGFTKSVSDNE